MSEGYNEEVLSHHSRDLEMCVEEWNNGIITKKSFGVDGIFHFE
jgi:hypothetical protein